jgi:hypothetical protein
MSLFRFSLAALVIFSTQLVAAPNEPSSPNADKNSTASTPRDENMPFTLHPEADKTDIFDLPMGTDEYDQQMEMQQMQEDQAKEQAKGKK